MKHNLNSVSILFIFLCYSLTIAQSQNLGQNSYQVIDNYARNCPPTAEYNVWTLAEYLQKPCKTDLEKSRVIFTWLTDHIAYDQQAFNTGNYNDYSAEAVLSNKRAVCDGFSNLFLALGKAMNLNIKKVSGYAKGYGYSSQSGFETTNHTWNIIEIDNKWRIFDATWGEGYGNPVNGKLVSVKKFDDFWFNVDPYIAIFTHLPADSDNSFVDPLIDLETYTEWEKIDKEYFLLGFDGKDCYNAFIEKPDFQVPECFSLKFPVEMIKAPLQKKLKMGEKYHFSFKVPNGTSMAITDSNGNWIYFVKESTVFSVDFLPQKTGRIKINVKSTTDKSIFHTIMSYEII